jgi:hypothetical protein
LKVFILWFSNLTEKNKQTKTIENYIMLFSDEHFDLFWCQNFLFCKFKSSITSPSTKIIFVFQFNHFINDLNNTKLKASMLSLIPAAFLLSPKKGSKIPFDHFLIPFLFYHNWFFNSLFRLIVKSPHCFIWLKIFFFPSLFPPHILFNSILHQSQINASKPKHQFPAQGFLCSPLSSKSFYTFQLEVMLFYHLALLKLPDLFHYSQLSYDFSCICHSK